jgi:hypothetical protein
MARLGYGEKKHQRAGDSQQIITIGARNRHSTDADMKRRNLPNRWGAKIFSIPSL